MSWQRTQITLYRTIRDTQGLLITVGEWLCMPYKMRDDVARYLGHTPQQLRALVDEVRAIDKDSNPEAYSNAKKKLPAAGFGGVFSKRGAAGLTQASKLVVLDIDAKDNPSKSTEEIEQIVSGLPWVCYAGRSVGGKGVWVLVQVSTEQHRAHCEQLFKELHALGIECDRQCTDIARTRLFSYDDNPAAFNPAAEIFARWYIPPYTPTKVQQHPQERGESDVFDLLDKLIRERVNICSSYEEWYTLAAALHPMGDVGRNYFHKLSEIDAAQYNYAEAEKKWQGVARMGIAQASDTAGIIFNMAKAAGCVLHERTWKQDKRTKPQPAPAYKIVPMPAPKPPTAIDVARGMGAAFARLVDAFECDIINAQGETIYPYSELKKYCNSQRARTATTRARGILPHDYTPRQGQGAQCRMI